MRPTQKSSGLAFGSRSGADAFAGKGKGVPGPGMYDTTSKRNQSGCSFGVKTGSSFARPGTASHVGPGAYGRENNSLTSNSKNVK